MNDLITTTIMTIIIIIIFPDNPLTASYTAKIINFMAAKINKSKTVELIQCILRYHADEILYAI